MLLAGPSAFKGDWTTEYQQGLEPDLPLPALQVNTLRILGDFGIYIFVMLYRVYMKNHNNQNTIAQEEPKLYSNSAAE